MRMIFLKKMEKAARMVKSQKLYIFCIGHVTSNAIFSKSVYPRAIKFHNLTQNIRKFPNL